ncbi:MAG: hypothetical protein AAGA72_18060 [Pseudomonadota bacterium]
MSKGFGIAALVLGIIGFFLPLVGLFVSWFALVCATVSTFYGGRGMAIATVIISAVAFLLTPTLWAESLNVATANPLAPSSTPTLKYICYALLTAPIVGIVISRSN